MNRRGLFAALLGLVAGPLMARKLPQGAALSDTELVQRAIYRAGPGGVVVFSEPRTYYFDDVTVLPDVCIRGNTLSGKCSVIVAPGDGRQSIIVGNVVLV